METQKRVAIVGSGLAGLVSANLLHNDRQQRYEVKVFESVSITHTLHLLNHTDNTRVPHYHWTLPPYLYPMPLERPQTASTCPCERLRAGFTAT